MSKRSYIALLEEGDDGNVCSKPIKTRAATPAELHTKLKASQLQLQEANDILEGAQGKKQIAPLV